MGRSPSRMGSRTLAFCAGATARVPEYPLQAKESPLFRRGNWHTETRLGTGSIGPWTIRQLLKRRLKDAGLPPIFTPHSFRVMVVTDLLGQDVPIEDVQYLASHQHPVTTEVYDRRARRVTRNIVERISVAVWSGWTSPAGSQTTGGEGSMSEDHTEFDAPDERERPRRALPWWRYRRERPAGPNRGPLLALERRFTREWADVYARQEREREELAGECRGEELRTRSDTMRVMHRAERSALAAAAGQGATVRYVYSKPPGSARRP